MDVDINGVPVIFPFKPYDIQLDYMRSVVSALQKKQDALLESPTGTGKTLSLLCSTLGWLDQKRRQDLDLVNSILKDSSANENLPNLDQNINVAKGKGWKNEANIRVIYSSRTHSQLNQACNELKKCYYNFIPTITIGSRDQLCINPEVTKLDSIAAKNQSCRQKVKTNTCKYLNSDARITDFIVDGTKVFDIEDLVKVGNSHKSCPYYLAREQSETGATLIFMPYNYVLDPNIRRTLKINLQNTIIIFDEGHNIEKVCEDSMSTEIKAEWISMFINTLDGALQALNLLEEGQYDGTNEKELSEMNIQDIAIVKMSMCDLEVELDNLVKENASKSSADRLNQKTIDIFQAMQKAGLDYSKWGQISSICNKLLAWVMSSVTFYMVNAIINAITSICNFFEILMPFTSAHEFEKHKADFIKSYKIYIETENENSWNSNWGSKKKSQNSWTIYLWCMTPSVAIKSLKALGVYNLIITSGTLAPLESFDHEMNNQFPIKLQNSHVISKNQLSVQVFYKDQNGNQLSGAYENRNNSNYYYGLGFTILDLAQIVPKGMFIFFSSYFLINKTIEMWKNRPGHNLFNSINSLKKIFIEPRNKAEFITAMTEYQTTIDSSQGAIFIGVSRGKLSEGIDLGDDYCRSVVIVGLPFPAANDPKVNLKKKFLNETNSRLNGSQWYMLQMKRAINQSVGRVVRHKDDYGSIIICDCRFKNDGLSKWVSAFLNFSTMNSDFKTKMNQIRSFYQQLQSITVPKVGRISQPTASNSTLTKSTSGVSKKYISSYFRPNVKDNADDKVLATFDEILKNSNLRSKSFNTSNKRSNQHLDSNSVFDSFETYSNVSNKKPAK